MCAISGVCYCNMPCVPSQEGVIVICHVCYRWHTWHITITPSWDGTHGILQWHTPEIAHMAYYNDTFLRWHTWHITITASWDGTHGILQWHPPEMAHMAYYNDTLLRCHTWHITMTPSWDGTHGILQWHPPEMAHYAMCVISGGCHCNMPCVPSQEGVIVICHVCHLRRVSL
jgi:hypothetical protein